MTCQIIAKWDSWLIHCREANRCRVRSAPTLFLDFADISPSRSRLDAQCATLGRAQGRDLLIR